VLALLAITVITIIIVRGVSNVSVSCSRLCAGALHALCVSSPMCAHVLRKLCDSHSLPAPCVQAYNGWHIDGNALVGVPSWLTSPCAVSLPVHLLRQRRQASRSSPFKASTEAAQKVHVTHKSYGFVPPLYDGTV
jgi:hypothetical protein